MIHFPNRTSLFENSIQLRPRYGEVDSMGVVYHSHYLVYFDHARTNMIRDLGMPYSEIEKRGYAMPVRQAMIDYYKPLVYDDPFVVRMYIFDIPNIRFHTYYKIFQTNNEICHAMGYVQLCFVNIKIKKPCTIPDFLLNVFKHTIPSRDNT